MISNLHDAIRSLNPNIKSVSGDDYDTCICIGGEKPAKELVEETALKIQEMYRRKEEYKIKRAAEYPPMADYLDGIVKGDQQQVQAYIDACLAVKAKYPKP